jgi:hypothetical protein
MMRYAKTMYLSSRLQIREDFGIPFVRVNGNIDFVAL